MSLGSIYRVPLKTPAAMVADIRVRAGEIQQLLDGNSFKLKDPLVSVSMGLIADRQTVACVFCVLI